jgi:hypothetical protein
MSNLSLIRVNQKLAQARQLIAGIDEQSLTPIHRNSLMEAAAFHLVCAYQHYICEIAETYGLKHAIGLRTELDLAKAFESAKKHPVEAEELSALRSDQHSWLAHLQDYYDSLWKPPMPGIPQVRDNLINAIDIDKTNRISEVTLDSLRSWHSEFASLVARQRETSAEF